jgi:hypothetical protein
MRVFWLGAALLIAAGSESEVPMQALVRESIRELVTDDFEDVEVGAVDPRVWLFHTVVSWLFDLVRSPALEARLLPHLDESRVDGRLITVDSAQTDECSICLERLTSSSPLAKMIDCDHVFHRACIATWLRDSLRKCPLCRK